MASIVHAVFRNGRPEEILPLSVPARIHVANHGRNERASGRPVQNMQQDYELRIRQPYTLSLGTEEQNGESSTQSGATLTPVSSVGSEQLQGSLTTGTWRTLLNWFGSLASSDSSQKDAEAFDHKHGYDRIKNERVQDFPKGFPQLAFLFSSDDDLAIFRGFKQNHARILSHLQVQITELEKELTDLDKKDLANPSTKFRLRTTEHKEGWDTTQQDLLGRIMTKQKEYDEFLLNHARIQALGCPPERNYRSVFNWIFTKKTLSPGSYDFIYHSDDFISVSKNLGKGRRSEKTNYFEEFIRWCAHKWPKSRKFLKTKDDVEKTTDPMVHFYSPFRIAVFARILLVSMAVGILLVPVFLLFLVPMSRAKMALTVSVFVLLFCVGMNTTTDAKTQEILIGTCTYGAVLVTFLGNLNANSGCGLGNSSL